MPKVPPSPFLLREESPPATLIFNLSPGRAIDRPIVPFCVSLPVVSFIPLLCFGLLTEPQFTQGEFVVWQAILSLLGACVDIGWKRALLWVKPGLFRLSTTGWLPITSKVLVTHQGRRLTIQYPSGGGLRTRWLCSGRNPDALAEVARTLNQELMLRAQPDANEEPMSLANGRQHEWRIQKEVHPIHADFYRDPGTQTRLRVELVGIESWWRRVWSRLSGKSEPVVRSVVVPSALLTNAQLSVAQTSSQSFGVVSDLDPASPLVGDLSVEDAAQVLELLRPIKRVTDSATATLPNIDRGTRRS